MSVPPIQWSREAKLYQIRFISHQGSKPGLWHDGEGHYFYAWAVAQDAETAERLGLEAWRAKYPDDITTTCEVSEVTDGWCSGVI